MKITMQEYGGCFGLELAPETMQEAALLVRFGANATKEVRTQRTHAHQDGTFSTSIVFGKHRRADSDVPRRR